MMEKKMINGISDSNEYDRVFKLNSYLHNQIQLYRMLISIYGLGFVIMSILYSVQPTIVCSVN